MTGPTTVLLVDDEPEVLGLTATYLERIDERVRPVTATSAAAGLETVESEPVDCVVSDYDMGETDGLAFLREVRERDADLPFILFTGKGSEEIASEAISAGVTDYLQKSAGSDQYEVLVNRIRNAVGRATAEERAAELARINDLIREVQGELVRAEGREEIYRIVCETLTDAEPYTLAWVGTPDEATGVIEPVSVNGEGTTYVDELTVRYDDTPRGEGPGGRAIRTREPQVVDDVGAEISVEAWRELVDEYGIESLIALPLVDDGTLHGVLPLYADRSDAFDGEERTVLTELADTVAAALTAAETRRQLEQYETVIDAVSNPLYVVDETGHVTFANEPLAALVGQDREAVVGTHVSEFLAPGETERLDALVADLVSSSGPDRATVEVSVERGDGTVVPCEDHVSILPFDEEFRGTAGIVRDISDRQADERARERLYEAAADLGPDAEATARRLLEIGRERLGVAEGKLIAIDAEADRHETVATAVRRSLDGEVKDLSTTFCREVLEGGLVAIAEASRSDWRTDPALDEWDHECYVGAEVVVEGESYGTVCFVDREPRSAFTDRELSFVELIARTLGHELERARAREHIEGREATLRRLHRELAADRPFEEAVDAILELGRETLGVRHGVMSEVDDDRYEMEHARSPREDVHPGAVFDLAEAGCVLTIREEATTSVEAMDTTEPWAEFPIHTEFGMNCYIGTPLVVDGELYGTLCFEDEEAREEPFSEWEETLVELLGQWVSRLLVERENKRLLERERDRLDEFAGALSHDLRAPLSVAAGRVELAREACTCGETDRSLATAADALDRMERLVERTLTLARQGRTVGETEPVELGRVVEDAWGGLDADGTALTLADDLPTVEADPARLRRLLENVLRNAITHGGETVTVAGTDGGFRVVDDGPGIPPDEREAVLEHGHSTDPDGTGFGLSIVARIAEAHGWSVRISEGEAGGAAIAFDGVTTVE